MRGVEDALLILVLNMLLATGGEGVTINDWQITGGLANIGITMLKVESKGVDCYWWWKATYRHCASPHWVAYLVLRPIAIDPSIHRRGRIV